MDADPTASQLASFLRTHRGQILEAWHAAVRDRPSVQGLSVERLLDHIPQLLDAIAESGEARMEDPRARLGTEAAERHALERLTEGLDLSQVVVELAVLRDCILQVWDRGRAPGMARPEVRFLNRSVDRAITASVDRYTEARDRTLRALDRISAASLESRNLDDLLERLLLVLVETTPSVDTGVILLRDGDDLVARASVGAEEEVRSGFRVPIGQGFAGRIAAERRPRTLSAECMHEVASPAIRAKGLTCLYGVPLTEDGVVVGVAHIGSATAPDFSEQDKRLFQTMAARATSGIVQSQLRERLEVRAAELTAILESIPDAVMVGDATGITLANRAALEMLGVDTVEEVNRHGARLAERFRMRRVGDERPLEDRSRPFVRALRGEHVTDELLLRGMDQDDDRVFRVAAAPVRAADRVVGAVIIGSDVTERRQREEEHQRLYEQARQAIADREHAMAVVSHDLRNPLSTISMSAATLEGHGSETKLVQKSAQSIRRAVDRMNRMISDLLDFSSIQAGRFLVRLQPVDAAAIVEEAVDAVRTEAAARGLELRLETEPLLIRGDRDRLVQALSNLLVNAVRATSEGTVLTSVERRGDEVVFAVVDTGPGIPLEAQAHLFEPYWRGKDPSYKGTGLGLAIASGIVAAHHGRIWVASAPGAGTAFHIAIPGPVTAGSSPRPAG